MKNKVQQTTINSSASRRGNVLIRGKQKNEGLQSIKQTCNNAGVGGSEQAAAAAAGAGHFPANRQRLCSHVAEAPGPTANKMQLLHLSLTTTIAHAQLSHLSTNLASQALPPSPSLTTFIAPAQLSPRG